MRPRNKLGLPSRKRRPENGEPDALAVVEALNAENSQLKDPANPGGDGKSAPAHRAGSFGR